MKWDDDIIFLFIKKIQSHPCLWNPNDKNKKNRHKVNDAFKSIAVEVGADNIEELKKKKEILFQTYRNYRRKISSSEKTGEGFDDVYKPTWPPYSFLDEFLHGIYTPKKKMDPLVWDTLGSYEEQKIEFSDDDSANNDHQDFTAYEAEELPSSSSSTGKDLLPRRSSSNAKRLRNDHERADISVNEIAENTNCLSRDECAVYGELIAIKLRKLDEMTRQLAMHKIDNILFDISFNRG